jgi:hypothetical protein
MSIRRLFTFPVLAITAMVLFGAGTGCMPGTGASDGLADLPTGESTLDRALPETATSGSDGAAPGAGEFDDGETITPPSSPADPTTPADGPTPAPGTPEQPQSGVLTAGSFDDNLNFDVFRAFTGSIESQAESELGIEVDVGTRALIRVVNDSGEAIGNAAVAVRTSSQSQTQSQTLLTQPSGTDGFVTFFTNIDGAGDATSFDVVVTPPGGGDAITRSVTLSDLDWTVTLPGIDAAAPPQLDLAFVVDATGSMGDELEFLKTEISSIAGGVAELYPAVTQRYALTVYRDEGDIYVTRTFDFTSSLDEFRQNLAPQRADGGGDWPEAMHTALADAANLNWSTSAAARVLFLIADAPPHAEFAVAALNETKKLRSKGVAIYPVAASGIGFDGELVMRLGALLTHSEYVFLTDDSGVGNSHEQPHIPCYHVQRLDQLMIRMVSAELAGHRIEPEAEQIIRTVGNPVNGVCTADDGQQQ